MDRDFELFIVLFFNDLYICQETAKAGTGEERLNTVDHVFYSRIAKRQPCQTQIQVYSLYYNKAYTPYFTQTNMCNIGHVGGGGHVTLPVIINLTAIHNYYKSHL